MKKIRFQDKHFTPSKIVCVGRNFSEHARELGNDVPEQPVIFIKPNSAISDTLHAYHGEVLHYEAEMTFLVVNNQLAAVGMGLDLTKRGLQSELKAKSLPWERAKSFNGAAVLSDFVTLPSTLNGLHFELHINGDLVQAGDINHMVFSPQIILTECETFLALEDGDVLMTGTPKGVGEVKVGDTFDITLFSHHERLLEQRWLAE